MDFQVTIPVLKDYKNQLSKVDDRNVVDINKEFIDNEFSFIDMLNTFPNINNEITDNTDFFKANNPKKNEENTLLDFNEGEIRDNITEIVFSQNNNTKELLADCYSSKKQEHHKPAQYGQKNTKGLNLVQKNHHASLKELPPLGGVVLKGINFQITKPVLPHNLLSVKTDSHCSQLAFIEERTDSQQEQKSSSGDMFSSHEFKSETNASDTIENEDSIIKEPSFKNMVEKLQTQLSQMPKPVTHWHIPLNHEQLGYVSIRLNIRKDNRADTVNFSVESDEMLQLLSQYHTDILSIFNKADIKVSAKDLTFYKRKEEEIT
ncbi:MAG: hypothetical protein ACTSXG_03725 [Alphaproteobacteria bacterium]